MDSCGLSDQWSSLDCQPDWQSGDLAGPISDLAGNQVQLESTGVHRTPTRICGGEKRTLMKLWEEKAEGCAPCSSLVMWPPHPTWGLSIVPTLSSFPAPFPHRTLWLLMSTWWGIRCHHGVNMAWSSKSTWGVFNVNAAGSSNSTWRGLQCRHCGVFDVDSAWSSDVNMLWSLTLMWCGVVDWQASEWG